MLSVRIYYNFHQTCMKSDYGALYPASRSSRLSRGNSFTRELNSLSFIEKRVNLFRTNVSSFTESVLRNERNHDSSLITNLPQHEENKYSCSKWQQPALYSWYFKVFKNMLKKNILSHVISCLQVFFSYKHNLKSVY